MTRLDIELVNRQICQTRSKAQMEIKNSNILVNRKTITKPAFNVESTDVITLNHEVLEYVSRGGLKLEKALNDFNIDLTDKTMLDIGSSTGGFTDCALKHNIKEVICVDVGSNQLDRRLRKNEKVHVFENTDIRKFDNPLLSNVDIVTIDISFISVTKIVDRLNIIKPQFECGKNIADKYKGIVLDKEVHEKVIKNIVNSFKEINYNLKNITFSPVKGGNGNIEYLAYFTKEEINSTINFKDLVSTTFKIMK